MSSMPLAAFTAGLASFLSPCVLPLVPGYVSLVSGAALNELRNPAAGHRRVVMVNSILFVLGFSVVFMAFGAVASTLGHLVQAHFGLLSKLAGAAIVLLGLHQTGLLPIRLLYMDRRFHRLPVGNAGTRAFLAGSAFGFGWTPCVGPILAVILTLAAAEATLAKGASLLALYALGLAVPFLLTALSIDGFLAFYKRSRRHLHTLEVAGGAVMVAVGILIFTRHFALLSSWLNDLPLFRALGESFL